MAARCVYQRCTPIMPIKQIDRLLNFFPSESHAQVLMDLSLNLKGVISQRLIPSKGKLVLATEVMMQSAFISDIILNGRINELKDAMKKSTEEGMQIFDDSLFALYKAGLITLDEAMENADSQADLSVRIRLEGWHLPI
jgi:twitching motility protein PilU